ncbi:MAG: ABC transporter ATP-binding protein [Gammaproteobacteria bacterium]|nr:ABC transporter ATP-binding protein [Gammaproteobacteria bacterium]
MIRLTNVERIFQVGEQPVHALDHINLTVNAGEYLSIMGPSGSGKSTLLNILGMLDRPNSGHYRLLGRDTTELNDAEQAALRRNTIGFVFQSFHLVPRLTAAQNIELPLVLAGIDIEERTARVAAILKSTDLSTRSHHRPDQLSGGQRQRVAIARATIMHPALLLTDEPTGNLDRSSGNEIIAILEQLNSQGITLIIVTHDQEIGQRAQRQLRMVDGRIVADQARSPRP